MAPIEPSSDYPEGQKPIASRVLTTLLDELAQSRRELHEARAALAVMATARDQLYEVATATGRQAPDPPDTAPGVRFEVSDQRVRMLFEVSKAQFFALEAAGRSHAQTINVVYPLGPWSDETCARWAVQHAIVATYPSIAEAPSVHGADR